MLWSHRLSTLLAATVFVATCDAAEPQAGVLSNAVPTTLLSTVAPMRPVQAAVGEALSAKATLREMLPDTAYAYARIPNAWGVIGTPTGGALDRAVGSAPYVEAVRSVRAGLATAVTPELPGEWQVVTRLFLERATSPIEVVVLPPPAQSKAPLPSLLLSARVDFADFNALNAFLAEAAKQHPQLKVVKPARADGPGTLTLGGLPAQVQLDPKESRLYLAAGTAPSPTLLADQRAQLRPNGAHAMFPLEKGIDESGQGLFLWLNAPKLVELATAMGNPEQGAMLAAFGITSMKGIGLGMGTSGGIHRLKVTADMPRLGFRAFLPVIKDLPAVQAAGAPSGVMVLGLPSAEDLAAIEAAAAMLSSPEENQKYQEGKQQIAEKLGFTVEDIFASLGQDLTILSDEAGQYAALRLKDGQGLQRMIDALGQRFQVRHEQREIGGHTYHHLAFPSLDSILVEGVDENEGPEARLRKRFFGVPNHIYWVQEGDHLLLASQPQVLIDRTYIAKRTPIDQWLQTQQRLDASGALLLGSVRSPGLPAMMYGLSLEALGYLGDVVGQPVDMFSLPTPREAGVPEQGAYGLKLASTEERLSFEVAFENNPLEILLAGNGYAGVAVVGILAAIAIPAYQDYTVKAQVAAAVGAANAARIVVGEFVAENGRFPNAEEAEAFDLSPFASERHALMIRPDDGTIVIELQIDTVRGETIMLTPIQQDTGLTWGCSSEMSPKYLPEECQ